MFGNIKHINDGDLIEQYQTETSPHMMIHTYETL